MTFTSVKTFTVEEFLSQYGDNPRYELIDGELRDLEPTGPHEAVSGKIIGKWYPSLAIAKKKWVIPKSCLIQPPAAQLTALRPDVIVLDEEKLANEPLWRREPIISSGDSIIAIAEVVSTNWQDDYARKIEEYRLLRVPEYWIVDFRGLGGLDYIGKPKQPTLTICQLNGDVYEKTKYRRLDPISSKVFPELTLTLDDIMPL